MGNNRVLIVGAGLTGLALGYGLRVRLALLEPVGDLVRTGVTPAAAVDHGDQVEVEFDNGTHGSFDAVIRRRRHQLLDPSPRPARPRGQLHRLRDPAPAITAMPSSVGSAPDSEEQYAASRLLQARRTEKRTS